MNRSKLKNKKVREQCTNLERRFHMGNMKDIPHNKKEIMESVDTRKRVNREWLDSHGFSPLKEVRKRIEGSYRVITQEWLDANGLLH